MLGPGAEARCALPSRGYSVCSRQADPTGNSSQYLVPFPSISLRITKFYSQETFNAVLPDILNEMESVLVIGTEYFPFSPLWPSIPGYLAYSNSSDCFSD